MSAATKVVSFVMSPVGWFVRATFSPTKIDAKGTSTLDFYEKTGANEPKDSSGGFDRIDIGNESYRGDFPAGFGGSFSDVA